MSKFKEVAKFEYIKTVKKPTFWISTLFLPLFIGLVSLVSGYSTKDATEKIKDMSNYSSIYIYDMSDIIPEEYFTKPIERITNDEHIPKNLIEDKNSIYIKIPQDFFSTQRYEIYYSEEADVLKGANAPLFFDQLLKKIGMDSVQDEKAKLLLTSKFTQKTFSYLEDGSLIEKGYEQYLLPILSLVIFFMAVFISSSFLLMSVSSEKENRMIETVLSIIDKKSLMIGKMIGLVGVVLTQLVVWLLFGIGIYLIVSRYLPVDLPIDLSRIDISGLPFNLFFIFTGFLFFAAVMTGVGAVGTGAEDSRNLSSIFIILSIFPIYLMQSLITSPDSLLAKIFSYFPFTSFMILLLRNSIGSLSTIELIIGIFTSILYVVVALYLSFKLFEVGCLMYNKRPSLRDILYHLTKR